MIEVERNSPVDAGALSEFFSRCGWEEPEGATKLEWALAASEEWVVCRLDGQMIGFGRSCRLGPVKRVVFDLIVDPRFRHTRLRGEIARLLAESTGGMEEISFFTERWASRSRYLPVQEKGAGRLEDTPSAPPKAYLGKRSLIAGGEE